jgi:hypothetical protein
MIIIFWEMTPCGSYKNRLFGGTYRLSSVPYESLPIQELTTSFCACSHSYTLKMEAIRSSETSLLIRSTRRHLPEDDNHHSHRRGNLKSYITRPISTQIKFSWRMRRIYIAIVFFISTLYSKNSQFLSKLH